MFRVGDKVTYTNGNRPIDCIVKHAYDIDGTMGNSKWNMVSIQGIGDDSGWDNVCAEQFVIPREPTKPWSGNVLKFKFSKER